MKKVIPVVLIVAALLLSACSSTASGNQFTTTSKNPAAQKFLHALNNSPFNLNITKGSFEMSAEKIYLPDHQSLYGSGLFFASQDLAGNCQAFGEIDNYISYRTHITRNERTEIFCLYFTKPLDGIPVPGNLEFSSCFQSALAFFDAWIPIMKKRWQNSKHLQHR